MTKGDKCKSADVPTGDENPKAKDNKAKMVKVMKAKKLSDTLIAFLLAFAMIETTHLTVEERDKTKDGSGGSANYTVFNLNQQMIEETLAARPALKALVGDIKDVPNSKLNKDTEEGLSLGIDLTLAGIEEFGLDPYISYLRGGKTLFSDKTDYRNKDCGGFLVKVFKCGFSKIADMILKDPKYVTDGRRIALCIPWVGDGDANSCG